MCIPFRKTDDLSKLQVVNSSNSLAHTFKDMHTVNTGRFLHMHTHG